MPLWILAPVPLVEEILVVGSIGCMTVLALSSSENPKTVLGLEEGESQV